VSEDINEANPQNPEGYTIGVTDADGIPSAVEITINSQVPPAAGLFSIVGTALHTTADIETLQNNNVYQLTFK